MRRELAQQVGVLALHEVFVVGLAGAARPVVAAVEQPDAVEDGELVVHVCRRTIDCDRDARLAQAVDVAALVEFLLIVGEQTQRDAPAMGGEYFVADAVVRECEDADFSALPGVAQTGDDRLQAIQPRAEARRLPAPHGLRASTVERAHDAFEPLQ